MFVDSLSSSKFCLLHFRRPKPEFFLIDRFVLCILYFQFRTSMANLNPSIKLFLLHFLFSLPSPFQSVSLCRNFCSNIPVDYPFSLDDGCGAPQFRRMLSCTNGSLFFQTPSGNYKVQSIDYKQSKMILYDPSMSTCSILQPHREFLMTDVQNVLLPPSPDTVFALLNCSVDSPVLNHFKYLCFNFSGHSCDELYGDCNGFRVFRLLTNSSPPCCFTGYETVKYMSMDVLDCSHFTAVYNTENLRGVGALDWIYGIKLSFAVPDMGCSRCSKSGGSCGFDTETEADLCLCSPSTNSTRECGAGSITAGGESLVPKRNFWVFVLIVCFVKFLFF